MVGGLLCGVVVVSGTRVEALESWRDQDPKGEVGELVGEVGEKFVEVCSGAASVSTSTFELLGGVRERSV
jgi:hypothetical protein